jgi:hypothetical protein
MMSPLEIQAIAEQRGIHLERARILSRLRGPKADDLVKRLAGFPRQDWQEIAIKDVLPMLHLIAKDIDGYDDADT